MQERHHIKTTPGEPHATPEFVPPPAVRKDAEGGNVQMDDINIPFVAVSVAFFAVLLAVSIVSLQAWFYNRQTAEVAAKTLARDDPRTELGALWQQQRLQLNQTAGWTTPATMPATAGATQSAPAPYYHIPVDDAMKLVVKDYSAGGGS